MGKKRFRIDHLAHLGRLELSRQEKKRYSDQLSDILDYVEQLHKVDTKRILAIGQVTGSKNIFRQDREERCLPSGQILKNAGAARGGYFKVKAIFKNKDE
jgi:aspartyl-tRNA(Asn)/glutamyl-tRNA(Gln) amidotransferase subunit C